MDKIITINLVDDENPIDALEKIKRLINDGYTSGYNPSWNLEEVK